MSYVLVNYVDVREETFILKKVSGLTIYSILYTLACNHRHQILKKRFLCFAITHWSGVMMLDSLLIPFDSVVHGRFYIYCYNVKV